jgi:hypothetical protein
MAELLGRFKAGTVTLEGVRRENLRPHPPTLSYGCMTRVKEV